MTGKRRYTGNGKYTFLKGARLAHKGRSTPTVETESGLMVRSKYEKECVRFFEDNNIEFQYEPLILLSGRQYRPDFFLPKYNLFIELCGYNHMPFYRDRVAQKRKLYEHHNLRAVFINYNGSGSLPKLLRENLISAGLGLSD